MKALMGLANCLMRSSNFEWKRRSLSEDERSALAFLLPFSDGEDNEGALSSGQVTLERGGNGPQLPLIDAAPDMKTEQCSDWTPAAELQNMETTPFSVNLHDISWGVNTGNGVSEKQEWSFTLYDFDGCGKVTKEDLSTLMKSLYGVVGSKLRLQAQRPGCRGFNLRLSVTPSLEQTNSSPDISNTTTPTSATTDNNHLTCPTGENLQTKEALNDLNGERKCPEYRHRLQGEKKSRLSHLGQSVSHHAELSKGLGNNTPHKPPASLPPNCQYGCQATHELPSDHQQRRILRHQLKKSLAMQHVVDWLQKEPISQHQRHHRHHQHHRSCHQNQTCSATNQRLSGSDPPMACTATTVTAVNYNDVTCTPANQIREPIIVHEHRHVHKHYHHHHYHHYVKA